LPPQLIESFILEAAEKKLGRRCVELQLPNIINAWMEKGGQVRGCYSGTSL